AVGTWTTGIRVGLSAGLSALLWAMPAAALPTPYQPQVGDTLRYALSNGDTATTRVVRIRTEDDRTYAMLERVLEHGGAQKTSRVTLVRSSEGIAFRLPELEGSGDEQSPLVCYLTQAQINDTWTAQKGAYHDLEGSPTEYRVYAHLEAIETLTVKAGTFPGCYRIAYRTAVPGMESPGYTMTVWFKPEVGIVKTRSAQGATTTETELVSYTLAAYSGATP
ncbi:MAG TPA: hypothetical protein V6D05_14550, partial [Stenomitos sp.]